MQTYESCLVCLLFLWILQKPAMIKGAGELIKASLENKY